MDESLQEIEAELKALKPRRPGPHLRDHIERELTALRDEPAAASRPRYTSATNLGSWKWFGWRSAGLAASLVLVAIFSLVRVKSPAPADSGPPKTAATPNLDKAMPVVSAPRADYQPVAATNVLYELQDEGPVYVDGDTPARRLRYRYLDTYTWKSPRGNASLKWSVPRDEIRVLPVAMN